MKTINLFAFLFSSCMSLVSAQPAYTVAYNENTAPLVPLIQAVYAEIGMQPVFVLVPSERAITGANGGAYDADLIRANGTLDAYPNLAFTREPIRRVDLYAYVKRNSGVIINTIADVKGHTVGLTQGSKLPEAFIKAEGIVPEVAYTASSLYLMLEAGRFEIALITSTQIISKSDPIFVGAKRVGPVLASSNSFHVLNKKHTGLIPKFDAAVKAMKADGRLEKLLNTP
jgi:polar amino acid transport system substrate-binding protein